MLTAVERESRVEDLRRLRRAEGRYPGDTDISTVRRRLEESLVEDVLSREDLAILDELMTDITSDPGERRSMAYHLVVSRRLTPNLIREAQSMLETWDEEGRINRVIAENWRFVLDLPDDAIKPALLDLSSDGFKRRANTPFVDILTMEERSLLLSLTYPTFAT